MTYTRHKDLPETLPDGQKSLTAAGWGEEPPARSKWWKVRNAARREQIRQTPTSETAEFEARREALRKKSYSLFRPLPRMGVLLSPLSASRSATYQVAPRIARNRTRIRVYYVSA